MYICNMKVEQTIEDINRSYPKPQCFLVALVLSALHGGTIRYNMNHYVTRIGDKFYDKSGEVQLSPEEEKKYLPLSRYYWETHMASINALIEKHKDNLPETTIESYSEYRIPSLDEFVEGFQYEVCNMTIGGYVIMDFKPDGVETLKLRDPDTPVWTSVTYTENNPFYRVSKDTIETQLEEGRIRVKRQ